MEQEKVISELIACLCNESEIRDMEVGLRFKDPFPVFE
jgi:hypothetical protein